MEGGDVSDLHSKQIYEGVHRHQAIVSMTLKKICKIFITLVQQASYTNLLFHM